MKGAVRRYFLIAVLSTRAPADVVLLGPSTRSGAAAWDSRYRYYKIQRQGRPFAPLLSHDIRFGIPAYSARLHVPIFINYCLNRTLDVCTAESIAIRSSVLARTMRFYA